MRTNFDMCAFIYSFYFNLFIFFMCEGSEIQIVSTFLPTFGQVLCDGNLVGISLMILIKHYAVFNSNRCKTFHTEKQITYIQI